MGRRPTRLPALEPFQRDLARLIDAELIRGQRADKTPSAIWHPWTNDKFGEALTSGPTRRMSANAVANWRNQAKPHPPDNIVPLLNAFYGDDHRFADKRQAMLHLWRQAKGYDIDDAQPPPILAPTHGESFQGPVQLVHLRAHPVRANDGTVRLNASLTISPDDGVVFQGRAVSIGLTEALLTFQSADWQPAYQALIGEKPHENVSIVAPGSRITGPRDTLGRLSGQPLGEEPIAIIEPVGTRNGSVTLSIRAPRGSFDVRIRPSLDSEPEAEIGVSDTKKLILDALLQEQLTHHDERGSAILAQVTLNPGEKIG